MAKKHFLTTISRGKPVRSKDRYAQLAAMLPALLPLEHAWLLKEAGEVEFIHDDLRYNTLLSEQGFTVVCDTLERIVPNPMHICSIRIGYSPMNDYDLRDILKPFTHLTPNQVYQLWFRNGSFLMPDYFQAHRLMRELNVKGFAAGISTEKVRLG